MSANTEHGRALAALGQNYANATTQIYQQQGENAARDVLQRGQIKGQLIQNVGQTIGQVLGPAVQQGIQQRKENQIKAVLQSYNNDLEKALPEILAIDRDVAMKMADQIHKQKIWVYDYKKLEHDSEGQKLQKVASKVYDIHDQATLTQARYALQQLGADISQYPTVYNEPEIKQLQERTRRVYEAWQGNFPKQPEPLRLGKDDTLVEPGTYKPVAYGSNAGPNAKPEEPPPGTPAHEAWVEKQRLATAGQPAAPAAAPVAAPLAALSAPTSLSVEQVEGRPPAAAPATPAAPARPAAPAATAPTTPETPAPYGNRYGTQTPKGDGFLGPLLRPDGKTMSEFSIDVTMDGKPVQIPTIVPTLTRSEIMQILHMKENDPLPQAIANKAVAHARQRIAAGKDPFAGPGEQQLKFPDLVVKTAGTAPPAASAAPTAPPAPKSDLDAWTQAYENIRTRRTKETADKPPTTGSFEDYTVRYAREKGVPVAELTTTQIEDARKKYQQSDDRPRITVNTGMETVPGDFDKTGEAFLDTIPRQWRNTVKQVANYELDPTKVASMRGGMRERLTMWVLQTNPSYDASEFSVRAPMRKAWTSGTQSRQINAINTAIGHIDQITTVAEKLNNKGVVPVNAFVNAAKTMFGAAAVTNFDTLKDALAGEVASVLSQSGATVSGIAEAKEKINAANSPEQLVGYVKTLIPVMGSKLASLDDQFRQVFGKDDPFSALSAESKRILMKHGFDPEHPTIEPGGVPEGGAPPAPAGWKYVPKQGGGWTAVKVP